METFRLSDKTCEHIKSDGSRCPSSGESARGGYCEIHDIINPAIFFEKDYKGHKRGTENMSKKRGEYYIRKGIAVALTDEVFDKYCKWLANGLKQIIVDDVRSYFKDDDIEGLKESFNNNVSQLAGILIDFGLNQKELAFVNKAIATFGETSLVRDIKIPNAGN